MNPKEHVNFVELERMRFFRSLYNEWVKELNKPAKEIIQKLKNNPGLIQTIDDNLPAHHHGTTELFSKTWGITGAKFAKMVYNSYHKNTSFEIRVKQGNLHDDYWVEYMRRFALTEAGKRITWINENTDIELMKIIRSSLNKSQEAGEGIAVIARNLIKDIASEYGALSIARAQRIARTEIIGASNRGSLLGAQSLGYNMNKVWFSLIDKVTRTIPDSEFDHVKADGETRGLFEKFTETGEDLDHPGDPTGSAGNVINCRCVQTYEVL